MLDLRELAVAATEEQLREIKRGVQAVAEQIYEDGSEIVVITGPPRLHKESGLLIVTFRRESGKLDKIFLRTNDNFLESAERFKIEANKLKAQIRTALENGGTKRAMLTCAHNYLQHMRINHYPLETMKSVMHEFPADILAALRKTINEGKV